MEQRRLLLAVPEIALTLQPLELAESRGGVLVEHGVTPEHHCHVFHLVPVDPSQDFGPAWVGCAVGDSVQRVQMDGFLLPRFVSTHSYALSWPPPPECSRLPLP
uniref:Uncharacterized protein n=1 Tax=Xiphophorus maculatus TaxID=8083 RepID=A0A3B5QAR9_XIPMA